MTDNVSIEELPSVISSMIQSYLHGSFLIECAGEEVPFIGNRRWLIKQDGIYISFLRNTEDCVYLRFPRSLSKGGKVQAKWVKHSMAGSVRGVWIIVTSIGQEAKSGRSLGYVPVFMMSIGNKTLMIKNNFLGFVDFVATIPRSMRHDKKVLGACSCKRGVIYLDLSGQLWYWLDSGTVEKILSPLIDGLEAEQVDLFLDRGFLWIIQDRRISYRWIAEE